jgi:hypothetical protein
MSDTLVEFFGWTGVLVGLLLVFLGLEFILHRLTDTFASRQRTGSLAMSSRSFLRRLLTWG